MVTVAQVRELLETVVDPEIPVLTLADLGVLRGVTVDDSGVTVTITPTYSGCPALEEMRADIGRVLARAGVGPVRVCTVLAPAWTTEDMSAAGRAKLRAYGIAPPGRSGGRRTGPVPVTLGRPATPSCPQCGAADTEELSRFGSTACQSMWRCRACREPFSHFRAH